jgi:hypothetical protein
MAVLKSLPASANSVVALLPATTRPLVARRVSAGASGAAPPVALICPEESSDVHDITHYTATQGES